MLSVSLLWVIISINLLPDNLRLHFIFSFLLSFALKLPISNFKKRSLILIYHSDLIQFKENYLLCFQGCVFSIQKKINHISCSQGIPSPVEKARLNRKHVCLRGYDYC